MKYRFGGLVGTGILWLLPQLAPPAAAQVITYDTFGPNNSFDAGGAWIIGGDGTSDSPYNFTQVTLFRPTASGYLTSVSAALYGVVPSLNSPAPPLTLQIHADNGGTPGSILESLTSNSIAPWIPGNAIPTSIASFNLGGTTLLSADQNYWLGFSAPNTTDASWSMNSQGVTSSRAYSRAPDQSQDQWTVDTQTSGAFRVVVNEFAPPPAIAPFSTFRPITLPELEGSNRVSFDGTRFTVNVDIGLRGGAASDDLRSIWEQGVEGYWNNNGYTLTDSSGTYGLGFNLNFVDVGPVDFQVNVQDLASDAFCRNNAVSWCTHAWVDYVAARDDMLGAVAAHEFGHLLGLYDEYRGEGVDPDLNIFERAALCEYDGPGESWGIWCDSLMADYGPVQDRYLDDIVSFISASAGNRNFVLGNNPVMNPYPYGDPGPYFQGIVEGSPGAPTTSVPEPSTWGLLCIGLLGIALSRRRRLGAQHRPT